MVATNYQLTMRTGPTAGKVFSLDKPELTLGRDLANDIVVNDSEVSRHHARIRMQPSGVVIEDLGSTNGTAVNGQRLMGPYVLRPGETVNLGEHVSFVFEAVQFDPDATVASASVRPQPLPVQTFPVTPESNYPAAESYPAEDRSYAGSVPSYGPAYDAPPAMVSRRRLPIWAIVLIVLFVVCVCGGVGYYLYIAPTSFWCAILPFLAGCP